MSARRAERIFYLHLTDTEAMGYLVREGIDPKILPTEELRPVLEWATKYFIDGGLTQAPSQAALEEAWVNRLNDNDIDLDDHPDDTIEWAVEQLKESWVQTNSQGMARKLVEAMAEAEEDSNISRVEILSDFATALLATATDLESGTHRVRVSDGAADALRRHDQRRDAGLEVAGLRFGLPMVDKYTHGIQPSELAILAAGPKTGKSFFLGWSALAEHEAGRPTCLYTLENTIEMTYDRLACMANGLDYSAWQRGKANNADRDKVEKWIESVTEKDSNCPLWVLQPPLGRQGFDSMVAEAKAREADSVIIDQLTFVEFPESRAPRHEKIGQGLHRLKKLLGSGRRQMSCLLAHQINREGVRAADKQGYPEMHHLAESAEVERTADWVFALYSSRDDREARLAKLFTLAARREIPVHYELAWNVGYGNIAANREHEITTYD